MGDIGLEPEPGEKILSEDSVHRVVDRVGVVDSLFGLFPEHGQSQIRGRQLLNVQLEGVEKALGKELEHFCLCGGEPDFVVRGVPDDVELAGGRSVHELNAREGSLIDLRDNIERSALKNGNKGLVDLLFGAGVAAATGDPNLGLMAGAGKQLLASPGVRSRMAFLADANARRNGAPARGLLGLMYQGEGAWADDERLKSRRGR